MVMSGTNGMDMNGADASAAAGFNTTKPNWHYTGPALPQAEAQRLLADGNNGPIDIHMAESGCAARLTSAEEIGAQQYVQATSAAVARFATPAEAVAAGYVPASPTDYPVVTYVNPAIVAANAAARRTLDPQHVDGLVYATTPSGAEVLAGALYILPATETKVPMPYGALVQWHRRTQVCGTGDHAHHAPRHHRVPALPDRLDRCADALHVDGLAGPGGRRPAGDPAARHPDRGGGRHGGRGDVGLAERMRARRAIPPRG